VLHVNSYHHQGVTEEHLAPGLVAAAWADSPAGALVEALEAPDGPFRVAVQCHPERTESSPRELEQLFAAFVVACREPLDGR
jgi:gamma-glutamyl-gamma-aminobutyrate hydrolase PuuD